MKVNDRYDFTPNEPQRESAQLILEADKNVIIPYLTHWTWMTKTQNMKMFPKDAQTWKTIEKLNQDKNVEWRHIFWVTHTDSVELDEKAC